VLINYESCICAFLLTALLPCLPCYYPQYIILFLHLLSTNHKCTQPCYFPLLYKPTAQKVKMDWNSLMRSSMLCAAQLPFLWCYRVFHCSTSQESQLSLYKHYLCNKYTLFMTFGYLWTLYVRVCGINDPGHSCDEYFGLLAKLSMSVASYSLKQTTSK
jgi:hypothetical protein